MKRHRRSFGGTKGFTLVELVGGLVLIALVAGIAGYVGGAVVERSRQRAAVLTLSAAQAEGHNAAARRDLQPGDQNLRQFPTTSQDLAAAMNATGLQFVTSSSTDSDTVSVHVVDPLTAVFGVQAGGRCLLLSDRLDGTATWARSTGTCTAALYDVNDAAWSDDPYSPGELSDGVS
jgi:type II secretory pathway pseudopilin PulG